MKKLNGTASWILAIIAVGAILYNTISVQAIARTDIKYIKAEIKEIKRLLFKYIIPGNADAGDTDATKPPS